jgi:Spy/CpxP family protein refolding chaperone
MNLKSFIAVLLISTSTIIRAQPEPRTVLPPPPGSAVVPREFTLPPSSEVAPPRFIERHFFAPELVMQHWEAIGLTPDQQTAIRAEMQKMMAQFNDLQRQESAEAHALAALVYPARTDEKAVLAQLDKLLTIEDQIKRLRTGVLIRIKNLLTPEQQAELRRLARSGYPSPKRPNN